MNCANEKLILFTRYPVAGKVKTRLIPELGEEKAASLQELMTANTVLKARCCADARNAKIEICFDGTNKKNMRNWLGNGPKYTPQSKGDLGRRMQRAFRDAFESGFQRVVIVGCDCPELEVGYLSQALEDLKDNDMTIGPAVDGGYYLIGLRKSTPRLFAQIKWGTGSVFEQTIKIAKTEGLKIAQLKKLSDVDRPQDLSICRNLAMFKTDQNTLSVIIAALNEQPHIQASISAALKGALEVIVADGGSQDNTVALARQAGASTLTVPYGRAAQFNSAALKAKGDVLLFLHADTILPETFAADILKAVKKTNVQAGAFKLAIDSDRAAIRMVETFTNLRSKFFQLPYGDQAIFMKRDTFFRLGGFSDLPIMEDYELVTRLRRRGKVVTLDKEVRTSARRWLQLGVLRTTVINQLMIAGYRLGISTDRLAGFYRGRKKELPENQRQRRCKTMIEHNKPQLNQTFVEQLRKCGTYPLRATGVDTLQMNIIRRCNLACRHCHVKAGPHRTEMMSREILTQCLHAAEHPSITTIDITGGAPEMHPDIEWLINEITALGKRIILRSNLVILLEPEYRHLTELFTANKVELIGSLSDYRPEQSDRQRGSGVYDRTVEAMRKLNAIGYGVTGTGLVLDLVHNPAGACLPCPQSALESEYRRVLHQEHNVVFSELFCMVNCPVGRYLEYLESSGNMHDYMRTLREAFNPKTTCFVMCRNTVSVGWDGRLFDCDFNQVENLTVNSGSPVHIADFKFDLLCNRQIEVRDHCFACTAGAGSSCCGALTD